MKNNKVFIGLVFLFGIISYVTGQSKIISPVAGTWSNKQSLVINLGADEEAYYTFSGADPMDSGLAYDGPVMIDQTGEVNMRIAIVSASGSSVETQVKYVVKDPYGELNSSESDFITEITKDPVYEYSAGNTINIPSEFLYCFSLDEKPSFKGRLLSLPSGCCLNKYFSFHFTDRKNDWQVVLHTSNSATGLLSQCTVPFKIKDWTCISFTNKKFIYSVDGGSWFSAKDGFLVDRSKEHKIKWQSVAYQAGNPVQEFTLPPKPIIKTNKNSDGSFVINLEGDSSFSAKTEAEPESDVFADGCFRTFTIDTFYGDEIKGTLYLSVYSQGIYQGKFSIPYAIDRKPPHIPIIVSDVEDNFSNKPVKISFEGDKDSQIYYQIQQEQLTSDNNNENTVDKTYKLNNKPFIVLRDSTASGILFTVSAYAQDSFGNESAKTSYSVTVDEYNYYIDSHNDSKTVADGTKIHPFTKFSDCVPIINNKKFTKIHIKGEVLFPENETIISSNCEILGSKDSIIVMPPSAFITIRSSSLLIKDCLIQRKNEENKKCSTSFFVLEHAVANINNCEIISFFNENGIVFNIFSSALTIKNSGITAQSTSYVSGISANDSIVKVVDSRISTVSPTAVNFSIQKGTFSLSNTECRLSGRIGRIAEFYGVSSFLSGIKGYVHIKKLNKDQLIYADDKTTFQKNENTTITEF